MIKRSFATAIAISIGILTLLGLLLLPTLGDVLLRWAAFLATVALLMGVLNLFSVHLSRLVRGNFYSGILILSMIAVLALGVTDALNITVGGIDAAFNWVLAPLEAALASLLAFFLLFAGFRLLQQQRSWRALVFLLSIIIILLSNVLASSRFLPLSLNTLFVQVQDFIQNNIVISGMRGILIGVALGIVILSLRLLVGLERPYNK